MSTSVLGYKAFTHDFKCRDFQYEVGTTYEMETRITPCESGFHFCVQAKDCNEYYGHTLRTRYARVEAIGDVLYKDDKCVTNKIKILYEISTQEWEKLVNGQEITFGHPYDHLLGPRYLICGCQMHFTKDIRIQIWYKDGYVHRDGDLPAIVMKNGSKFYYKNDKLHRDGNLPAIEACHRKAWFIDGQCIKDEHDGLFIRLVNFFLA